jgi:hypothetical protein
MVEMQVGEEEMNAARAALREVESKCADSRAGIEYEGRFVVECDFDA